MLDENDNKVARAPVAKQRQEVLQVGEQVVPASESQGEYDAEAGDSLQEARDAREPSSELLARNSGGVGVDNVAVDATEHEKHEQELGEAMRVECLLDQEADAAVFVGVSPVGAITES